MNTEAEPVSEFDYRGFDLANAIDALMAYDHGATDSGISDYEMKDAVRSYLDELGDNERRIALAKVAQAMLSDERIEEGYGLDEVAGFSEWIEELL